WQVFCLEMAFKFAWNHGSVGQLFLPHTPSSSVKVNTKVPPVRQVQIIKLRMKLDVGVLDSAVQSSTLQQ
ncbi:Copal-8-ol diphosphate hydratase, chloroplastic, partial [Clarias magur]